MTLIPKILAPVVIDSTNNKFDFVGDGGTEVATLTTGTYQTILDFLDHLTTQMTTEDGAGTYTWTIETVSLGDSGHVTIARDSATWGALYGTGANLAKTKLVGAILGFAFGADDTPALSQEGDYQHASGWYPNVPVRFDSLDWFVREAADTETLSGVGRILSWGEKTRRTIDFEFITPERALIAQESATDLNRAFERLWRGNPSRFTYFEDNAANQSSQGGQYRMIGDLVRACQPDRMFDGVELYKIKLALAGYVA